MFEFLRKDEKPLDQMEARVLSMIGDARHSFDLATGAVLSGASAEQARAEVEVTDERINQAEQELRQGLVVHVAVQGTHDIGTVLGTILLIKKIERIGDQAKNILDLTAEGVSLVDAPDIDEFIADRNAISQMFADASALLADHDDAKAEAFIKRSIEMRNHCEEKVREYMHSDEPGHWAVPRAILYRYWKRIAANLLGVVTTTIEPLQHIDYIGHGEVDIDDD
jgi:phosphate uptake regulator